MREMVRAIKTATACLDCQQFYHWMVMEFDHRPGEVKLGEISQMLQWSAAKVLAEIAKCDLVCANCHRLRTARRLGHL